MSDELHLKLLGGLSAAHGDTPLHGFSSAKERALLCYLAVNDRTHARASLATLLWGEMPEERASHSLRQALSTLQRMVGPYLAVTRQTVAFDNTQPFTLDTRTFAALVGTAESLPSSARHHLRAAIDLYAGDFLAGFSVRDAPEFDAWVSAQREYLRQLALDALSQLIRQHYARAEYADATRYATRLLDLDPWRESGHRQLMILLAYQDQREAALAQFDLCCRTLADALGTEPEAKTVALYQRIRAGSIQRPTRHAPSTNLPAAPTPIVGRQAELAAIIALLDDPSRRLLTLVGPGGIGKTRLALQTATDLLHDFRHGVFFVSLAPVRDARLMLGAIARVLGVEESASQPLAERLTAWLRDKELLLVLDNFEQLIPAAPLLATLLEASRGMRALITSRASLRLRGERIYEVPPLALPALDTSDPARTTATAVAQSPAAIMFAQWARAVVPDFAIDESNALLVAEVCARLEGLPLAIELATVRLRGMSLPTLLERLDERLAVLTAGPRDLPARQRTLRDTIAWSYDLLSDPLRQLFRQLGVFVGGCTPEAAAAVCATSAAPTPPATQPPASTITEGLEVLLANSLVRRDVGDEPDERNEGVGPGVRYTMLESIREYALKRLHAVTAADHAARRGHAEYFLQLAETAQERLNGPEQHRRLHQLETEHNNLRAALSWARASGATELGLRLGTALWPFWRVRGYLSEGRHWLETLLARPESAAPLVRARALRAAGALALQQGDLGPAGDWCAQSLAICVHLRDREGECSALNSLGNVLREQGDYRQAATLNERYLALCRELGDERGVAVAYNSLATTAHRLGDLERAADLYAEGLARRRALRDDTGVAYTLGNFAEVTFEQGDLDRAAVLSTESLAIYRELRHKWGMAHALRTLGAIACAQADLDHARSLCDQSRALYQEIGETWGVAGVLATLGTIARTEHDDAGARVQYEQSLVLYREGGGNLWEIATVLAQLADLALETGDALRARALFAESLVLSQRMGNVRFTLRCLDGLAAVAALDQHLMLAAHLWSSSAALRLAHAILRSPAENDVYQRAQPRVRAALGVDAWAAASGAGQVLSIEQAIAAALGDMPDAHT